MALKAFRSNKAGACPLDVIESIPVAEAIKQGATGTGRALIDAYCESIRNLGRAGVAWCCATTSCRCSIGCAPKWWLLSG